MPMPSLPSIGRVLAVLLFLSVGTGSFHLTTNHAGASPIPASTTAGSTSPTGTFANGSVLPNGRLVTPAGSLYDLGDFPLGLAVSPGGVLAVAINSGQGFGLNKGFNSYCTAGGQGGAPCPYVNPSNPVLAATAGNPATHAPDESLTVVNLRTGSRTQVTAVPTTYDPAHHGSGTYNDFYCGVAFSPDGTHLYAAGGTNDALYDFAVSGDVVSSAPLRTIKLPSSVPGIIGSGITKDVAVTPDGKYVLVTHELDDSLDIVDTSSYAVHSVSFGLPFLGDGYPYGVVVSPDSRKAYVALQGAKSVAVLTLRDGTASVRGRIGVGDHPTALALSPDGSQLYVANANDDTLSVVTTADNRLAATVTVHAMPDEQLGSTPDAVAVSPDGQRIYVALAGDDAVAVLGGGATHGTNSSPLAGSFHVLGFLPAGWYPSALAVSRSGDTVYVVSAKGLGSRPGPVTSTYQYDGNNMPGLLQAVPVSGAISLQQGTTAVRADIENATADDNSSSASNPIPATIGGASPIQHVVLIVRENRTFDQVLGDVGTGEGRSQAEVNGDPAYTVFGREATPNAHALVGDPLPGSPDPAYASSDNFYSDGEASIQGHYWTTSANVSDYVEKSWRLYYSPRPHLEDPLSSLAEPGGCSIFQSALQRQSATGGAFTFKDYGEEIGVSNAAALTIALKIPGNASLGVSEHCTAIPSVDLDFANGSIFSFDTDNRHDATAFLADNGLTTAGTQVAGSKAMLRNFSYVTLPGDHTGGLAFADTPRSRVAQNDAGLGLIVQSLSHSRYWASTAIFVMEDDSQDGLDHIDGHRNLLYVISPYAKHTGPDGKPGYFSHMHYSQASVLKTIELILDLPYLSTYDQNASALYNLFQTKNLPAQLTAADLDPFVVQPLPSFIDETSAQYRKANPSTSMLPASESQGLNLQAVDLAGPMLEVVDWQLAHPVSALPQPLVKELRQASLAIQHAAPIVRLFQPQARGQGYPKPPLPTDRSARLGTPATASSYATIGSAGSCAGDSTSPADCTAAPREQ